LDRQTGALRGDSSPQRQKPADNVRELQTIGPKPRDDMQEPSVIDRDSRYFIDDFPLLLLSFVL
jgi:hypothetical protein